jgi:hypothetical protein
VFVKSGVTRSAFLLAILQTRVIVFACLQSSDNRESLEIKEFCIGTQYAFPLAEQRKEET